MKTLKQPPSTEHDCLQAAKLHFEAAGAALRKGCAEALLTGLNLISLHGERAGQGHGGNRVAGVSVSRDTLEKGFNGACEEIGIKRVNAYRWMNACAAALIRAGMIEDPSEVEERLPKPGSKEWAKWESKLQTAAEGMSLNRLLLGQVQDGTEEHRFDRLITESEAGNAKAEEVLQDIASGKLTLVQAIRAASGAIATKNKERKDPVYLEFDAVDKKPVGLIPKAFTTLENGFTHWDSYDADAREAMKRKWVEVVKSAPKELTELFKK